MARALDPRQQPVWTWDKIDREWLQGDRVDYPPATVVAAFQNASHMLGDRWVAQHHSPGPAVTRYGPPAVLPVIRAGLLLRAVDGVGAAKFFDRLKRNEWSAWTELAALRVLRPDASVGVDYEASAPETASRPDFTLTHGQTRVYAEIEGITQPEDSQRFQIVMGELWAGLEHDVPGNWTAEFELERLPSPADVQTIRRVVRTHLWSGIPAVPRDLELGLSIGLSEQLGRVRLSAAAAGTRGSGGRGPSLKIAITGAFRRGALQLPPGRPGLVVVHGGPYGLLIDPRELPRLVHPGKNTRVAAIVLIREWQAGWSLGLEAYTYLHPAPAALPQWLLDRLRPSIGSWAGGWLTET